MTFFLVGETMPTRAIETDDNFLARRYLAALGLVAALILMNQAMVQPPFYELSSDAPAINVASRQGMLCQQLAKTALKLELATEPGERKRTLQEMQIVLREWWSVHEGLKFGDAKRSLSGRNSRVVDRALAEVDFYFKRIAHASSRLADQDRNPIKPGVDLGTILDNERAYLNRMERIVKLYEVEARERIDGLRRTGWVLTGLILVALIGIGMFILRPAARLIRLQFTEVREARDALEVRVRERTAELERANRDLKHEVHERALADARHRALIEQFSHVARTNTIGEMATGLAHELNQPLGAVANYVEGCLVALDAPSPRVDSVKEALGKALAATLRAGAIIRRIRRFVTRRSSEPEMFGPGRVVEEVEALFRDESSRLGIRLKLDLAGGLPELSGDPVQVQQVLVNLVRNATEAVASWKPLHPTVTLAARPDEDGAVEFLVSDNGEGIPPDRLAQVFDPFFSTRAEGMGMGLAISRTIVEAHHGRLAVESDPGVRTTFRFTLPPASGDDDGSDSLCG